MASEMVERVARAICQICEGNPNRKIQRPDFPNERLGVPIWLGYVDEARAAIAAMREPTEAMECKGQEPFGEYWDDANALKVWQAMIDEALK